MGSYAWENIRQPANVIVNLRAVPYKLFTVVRDIVGMPFQETLHILRIELYVYLQP